MPRDTTNESGKTPENHAVEKIVDSMEKAAHAEQVSMQDLVTALGRASFVPVLMAPALTVVSPLSGVPLFSSLCGLLIALVAGQMLARRKHLWLPGWLMHRRISGHRLREATDRMRKPARFLDRISKPRLSLFVHRPFRWITEIACLLCGLVMPLLEFVPFTSSILGAAVVLFSLSLLVKDGLFALFAFGFIGAAGYTLFAILA